MASKRLSLSIASQPLTALILLAGLAACHEADEPGQAVGTPARIMNQSAEGGQPAGEIAMKRVSDALITTKVKTAIFRDPMASGFQITVNTYRGVVQISGFVDTIDQKQRAGELAESIEGVREVHNDLIVTNRTSFIPSDAGKSSAIVEF